MMIFVVLLLLLLSGVWGQYGCVNDVSAGVRWFKCPEFGNLNFTISVPEECVITTTTTTSISRKKENNGCGLIFDVHGWSMNADSQEANTRIREFASSSTGSLKFIVVQPTANGVPLPSWSPDDDYLPLIEFFRFVQTIQEWNIDQKRKHFTGFSQGGSCTWRMLCEYGYEFASAAPSASGSAGGSIFSEPCFETPFAAAAKIPIFFTMGEYDSAYASGERQKDNIITAWNLTDFYVLHDHPMYRHTRYYNDGGYLFEYLTHKYQAGCALYPNGHCYPGGLDPEGKGFWMEPLNFGLSCPFPNPQESAFIYGQKIVEFFINNPAQE